MKIGKLMLGIPLALCTVLLISAQPGWANTAKGGVTESSVSRDDSQPAAAKLEPSQFTGKIIGRSNKAKSITIADNKLGNVMIKFNENTLGLEHAQKDEAAIINFRIEGNDRIATVIEPKLAKLPQGVSEITPDELAELIAAKSDFMLIDSRPGNRYDAGHIRTAVSIPVTELKAEGKNLLPQDNKDKLLLFYCGGPT